MLEDSIYIYYILIKGIDINRQNPISYAPLLSCQVKYKCGAIYI